MNTGLMSTPHRMSEIADEYGVSMSQVMRLGALMDEEEFDFVNHDDYTDEVEYLDYYEGEVPSHRLADREFYERTDITGIEQDSELIPEEIYGNLKKDLEEVEDIWLDPSHVILLALGDVTSSRHGLTSSYCRDKFNPNDRPLDSEELCMYLNGFGYDAEPRDVETFMTQEIRKSDLNSDITPRFRRTPENKFELNPGAPEKYVLSVETGIVKIVEEVTVTDKWVQENEEEADIAIPTDMMQTPPDESFNLEKDE